MFRMLHRIEITGFDRSIQIAQLAQVIQTAAPLEVELGIVMQHSKLRLHPPKQEGRFRPRNPDWDQILEAEAAGLRLACHASGSRILKALLRGRLPDLRHPAGLRPFKTLQLNTTTRAQPFEGHIGSKRSMYTSYVHFIEDLIAHDELRIEEVLAQLQPTTEVVVQVIVSHKVQPIIPAALLTLAHRCQNAGMTTRLLLDTSGGRGKAALECWPSRTALGPESADLPIGFAGGLTPDNIPQAL
ncbi:MAG: hypothetical protein AAFS10_11420, partial [Myxococcota bacterium]